LTGVSATTEFAALRAEEFVALTGVSATTEFAAPHAEEFGTLTGVAAISDVGSFFVEDSPSVYLLGVQATAEFLSPRPEEFLMLAGVQATTEFLSPRREEFVMLTGVQATANVLSPEPEEFLVLRGVQASAQVGSFPARSFPGSRTFFIASTTQKVIAPGMQMYPTSDTINLGPSPYIAGSSQFYAIGQVIWNGAVKVEGTDWSFVSPFSHIVKILNEPTVGTPITLRYVRWNIQVTRGFTVTSYPVPFSFVNATIVADAMPPIDKYFTVNFIGNRIANNPQTLFSIFPLMVDDMLVDHTLYDGSKGFQTYRPRCYQVLDTTLMQIFEWTGSAWVAVRDVANGTPFYVKSLRQVWENQAGTAVLKYTAGDGPSGSYPEAVTYPPFGEGVGKNLLVDGFSADAPTQYPAAYQICQSPGPYDSVCEDEGFDQDFDFSFS